MCTVVIEVPRSSEDAVRVLAVRDESPERPWDPPGEWWPDELPGVIGVRDRLANGAWLAAAPEAGRLAVLLNRAPATGLSHAQPVEPMLSRGAIVLDAMRGEEVSDHPRTATFNLVEVRGSTAKFTSWDGGRVERQGLGPSVHMVAHHGVNDEASARIARWLPDFQRLAGLPDDRWRAEWETLLERTPELHPDDDRAIIRDNHVHGYPTQSLIVVTAALRHDNAELEYRVIPNPLR